jgi:retron-type reverse transcriptase
MKRHFHLWSQITAFSNLIDAARKAQKGKRYRENVLEFNYNLETELLCLQKELIDKTYQPGTYKTFEIVVPKRRLISAAPYRDRIVHHALCNIIVPLVEPSLIFDTYANRCYKGSHRALRRFTCYARSSQYILQCDLQKYFPSIDREILKEIVRKKIGCNDTLWLIDLLIDNSNEQPPAVFHSAIATATAATRIGLRYKHRLSGASHTLFTELGSSPQAWRYSSTAPTDFYFTCFCKGVKTGQALPAVARRFLEQQS